MVAHDCIECWVIRATTEACLHACVGGRLCHAMHASGPLISSQAEGHARTPLPPACTHTPSPRTHACARRLKVAPPEGQIPPAPHASALLNRPLTGSASVARATPSGTQVGWVAALACVPRPRGRVTPGMAGAGTGGRLGPSGSRAYSSPFVRSGPICGPIFGVGGRAWHRLEPPPPPVTPPPAHPRTDASRGEP